METTVVPETSLTCLSLAEARSRFPQAYDALRIMRGFTNEEVDADAFDDDTSIALFQGALLALTLSFDFTTDVLRWTGDAWVPCGTTVEEDDADNPETPQSVAYLRITL